jgi:hypothetical protein
MRGTLRVSMTARFDQAVRRFDEANGADPNRTLVDGREVPNELLYAIRMTRWLDRLEPDASEALRLAARAQHICRWMIPRDSYPMTRAGYHRWRTELGRFHAEKAAQILRDVGYDDATVARVPSLIRKENLKSDPEAQRLEDVICLVFLQHYLAEFAAKHDDAKLVNILRRTWRKMSDVGHAAAMQLNFGEREQRLIEEALKPAPPAESSPPGETEGP